MWSRGVMFYYSASRSWISNIFLRLKRAVVFFKTVEILFQVFKKRGPGWCSWYTYLMGWTVWGLNPGAGKIFRAHPSVEWVLCASQRVTRLKKLYSGACTPCELYSSIKKINISKWLKGKFCCWVCCHAFGQWVIVMSCLVLDPFLLIYVLQILSWEDTKGSCYVVGT